jgi:hypothetical protein
MEASHNYQSLVRWLAYLIFLTVLNETVFNISTRMIAMSARVIAYVIRCGFFADCCSASLKFLCTYDGSIPVHVLEGDQHIRIYRATF